MKSYKILVTESKNLSNETKTLIKKIGKTDFLDINQDKLQKIINYYEEILSDTINQLTTKYRRTPRDEYYFRIKECEKVIQKLESLPDGFQSLLNKMFKVNPEERCNIDHVITALSSNLTVSV